MSHAHCRARLLVTGAGLAFILCLLLAATAHASVAQFERTTYNYVSSYSIAQEANSYQVLVMQSTNSAKAAQLKAANPNLKILMYMDPLTSDSADPTAGVECTSYSTDLANNPSWFLKDQSGKPILQKGTTTRYVMDVGNPAYQQACLSHATALAKQNGFDGIWWDDIETDFRWVFNSGVTSPQYPTAAAYYGSFVSFVNYAGPQIRSQSLLSVGNLCAATAAQWQALTRPLDGSEEESFTDGGVGLAQQIPFLATKLANVAWSEANGKLTLLHSYNATHAGNTYGLGSMLLVANGHASYSTSNNCYTNCEAWYPEYSTAQQLGTPVGTYMTLPNGVYVRWFTKGVVLVNATTNSIPSMSLGGGTYTGTGLTSVSSVSMAPTTAYVLLADATNTVSAPANTSAPGITGSMWLGQTLTANPGSWSGSPAPTFQYQWSRCSSPSVSSCVPITGATNPTYVVQSTDIGQYLAIAVTATNSGGVATAAPVQTIQIPAPTFSLTASPTSQSIRHGYIAYYTIYVHPLYGWKGSINLSAGSAPTGASTSFSSVTTSTASTLHVNTTSATPLGTWTVKVTGSGSGQTSSVSVGLTTT